MRWKIPSISNNVIDKTFYPKIKKEKHRLTNHAQNSGMFAKEQKKTKKIKLN